MTEFTREEWEKGIGYKVEERSTYGGGTTLKHYCNDCWGDVENKIAFLDIDRLAPREGKIYMCNSCGELIEPEVVS